MAAVAEAAADLAAAEALADLVAAADPLVDFPAEEAEALLVADCLEVPVGLTEEHLELYLFTFLPGDGPDGRLKMEAPTVTAVAAVA